MRGTFKFKIFTNKKMFYLRKKIILYVQQTLVFLVK